jgi:hypothetical protein
MGMRISAAGVIELRKSGVIMRRSVPADPASSQQILELRDQGLTLTEVAEQVGMTVSGLGAATRGLSTIPRECVGARLVQAEASDCKSTAAIAASLADALAEFCRLERRLDRRIRRDQTSEMTFDAIVPACRELGWIPSNSSLL